MIKYYCDICQKEVGEVEKYILPKLEHKNLITKNCLLVSKTMTATPKTIEICEQCALNIHNIIQVYQYYITNDMEEVNLTLMR